jgi:tRNA pseudouridine55 synthase
VRSIARDTGVGLGVPAHLKTLRRTSIGDYRVEAALPLDALTDRMAVQAALVAPLAALTMLPVVDIETGDVAALRHGRAVKLVSLENAEVAAAGHDGELIAIGRVASGVFRPSKVFGP